MIGTYEVLTAVLLTICVSGHVVRDVLKDHCTFMFILK